MSFLKSCFKLSNIINFDTAKISMIEAIKKTYGKKGEKVLIF